MENTLAEVAAAAYYEGRQKKEPNTPEELCAIWQAVVDAVLRAAVERKIVREVE